MAVISILIVNGEPSMLLPIGKSEDITLRFFGGNLDRSQFALQLSPDHRVSFTMDAKVVQVPIWDGSGSLLSAAATLCWL